MKKFGNVTLGIVFLLGAVCLLGQELGIIKDFNVFGVAVGAVFAISLVKCIINYEMTGAVFSFALLYMFAGDMVGLPDISWFTMMMMAVLVSVGLHFIFPKYNKACSYSGDFVCDPSYNGYTKQQAKAAAKGMSGKHTDGFQGCFGGYEKYIQSKEFEYGKYECTFSSMNIYFDQAVMKNQMAIIDIEVAFSSATVYIPRNWGVSPHTDLAFSSFKVNGKPTSTEYTLVVNGDVAFGTLEIVYI